MASFLGVTISPKNKLWFILCLVGKFQAVSARRAVRFRSNR